MDKKVSPSDEEYQPTDISDTAEGGEYGALYNLEAEQAILGGILIEPSQFTQIEGALTPEDFFWAGNATIFRAMLAAKSRHGNLDPVLILDELRGTGKLENIGGKEALMHLTESVISGAHIKHYADVVKELSALRQIIQISNETITHAAAVGVRHVDVVSEMDKKIHALPGQSTLSDVEHAKAVGHSFWTYLKDSAERGITGLPTGYLALDKLLTGLHPEELIVIAGRPTMGKTTFALNIARNNVFNGETPTTFFTLEMPAREIYSHVISAEARVPGQRIRKLTMDLDQYNRLSAAAEKLDTLPFWIGHTPAISLVELSAKCRQLNQKNQLKLVIVDYLQLMTASNLARGRSREQEVAEITRGLKALAEELYIPVIALSQLSRKPEGRSDPKPILSDLRESGAIEQDADVVMFIHRPDYYHADDQPGMAEIIVAKQRNGPTDTIRLTFLKDLLRFENYTSEQPRD